MSYFTDKDFVSTDNSSTTLLTNGSSFTGAWEDTKGFTSVKVAVKTDQNGTYTIQWSPDGTNQDSTLTRYYRTSQIEPPHKFENMRRYVRVVFTNNSGSDQTYFRLQTTLSNSAAALNIPVDGTMSQDYDAISTRPTDFTAEVALGRRQGWTTWNKFGYNTDVDTTTDPEILASWGGTFQYLTAGETINIVSSSANDIVTTGSGVRQVIVYGVDSNWDTTTEIVDMNGTGTATTTTSFIGINRIATYTVGAGKVNAGTITATASSSGYTMGQMPVGEGTTQQCVFTVPQNHQFLADWLWLNALKEGPSTAPIVTFKCWVYSAVTGAEYEVFRGSIDTTANTLIEVKPPEPFTIGEKSIFWLTAETTQNDTSVRGRFSGKLVRDVDA